MPQHPYQIRQSSTALSFYTGINVGILFGYHAGGWINEYFGWRQATELIRDRRGWYHNGFRNRHRT